MGFAGLLGHQIRGSAFPTTSLRVVVRHEIRALDLSFLGFIGTIILLFPFLLLLLPPCLWRQAAAARTRGLREMEQADGEDGTAGSVSDNGEGDKLGLSKKIIRSNHTGGPRLMLIDGWMDG